MASGRFPLSRCKVKASRLPGVNRSRPKAARFPAALISMQTASHWQAFARYLAPGRNIQRWQRVAFGADTDRRGNEPLALGPRARPFAHPDRHHGRCRDHRHRRGRAELGSVIRFLASD